MKTTISLAAAFDEPQWKWHEEDGNHSTAGIDPTCAFCEGRRSLHECRLYLPMEFYHFFRSLHGMEAQATGFTMQKVGKRFYFSYGYRTPTDKGAITLWYWTPGTLPPCMKRYTR